MRIQSLVGNIRKDGSFKMKKRLHWVKRRWNAHCTFWEHPFLSTISRTMKTWHREKFSEPNLALFSGVTVIDLLLSPPGGDSRKWVKAMFLEKGGLCQTKLLNKGRGGGGSISSVFIPVKFPSFCLQTNMTVLHKQQFKRICGHVGRSLFPFHTGSSSEEGWICFST